MRAIVLFLLAGSLMGCAETMENIDKLFMGARSKAVLCQNQSIVIERLGK